MRGNQEFRVGDNIIHPEYAAQGRGALNGYRPVRGEYTQAVPAAAADKNGILNPGAAAPYI